MENQSRMRMIVVAVMLLGLVLAAIFTILLGMRPGDETATEDPLTVPDATANIDIPMIEEFRQVDGANIRVLFPSNLSYTTATEQVTSAVNTVIEAPAPTADPNIAVEPTPAPAATDPVVAEVPTEAVPAVVIPVAGGDMFVFQPHTVVQGDNMYRLAQTYNTSIAAMAAIGGIDASDMVAGSVIQIPVVNPAYCGGQRSHLVVEGDNVFRIAQTYATTKELIQQANGLDGNFSIKSNTVLCIP